MMADYGIGTPYWYEWEVGLVKCLEMMLDSNIESVTLQSPEFQSIDDVVVNYKDNSSLNIQVKHTDIDENFTYSTLVSGDSPMLKKWATEWKKKKNNNDIKEIRIVTNKHWGVYRSNRKCSFKCFIENVLPKLKADYNYSSSDTSENLAIEWFKDQIDFLQDDAYEFTKIINFYQEVELGQLGLKIRDLVKDIVGTDAKEIIDLKTNALLSKLEIWATSQRKQHHIHREDMYETLGGASKRVAQFELYPEKPIFPSRKDFANNFVETLLNCDNRIVFLQGLPGSGKTNFISYLAQKENTIVDFRFYTYIPVNKSTSTFSDDEGFYTGDWLWHSILTQLATKFEKMGLLYEIKFPLIYSHLTVTEMRELALNFLKIYSEKSNKTCFLFIDGLDHAARSINKKNSFLYQLPLPNEVPEGVKFVLIGQPLKDSYPSWMDNNEDIKYIDLPVIEERDIDVLLHSNNIIIDKIATASLSQSIISVVGNNALNVLFAIYEIKSLESPTFEEIVNLLEKRYLNGHINKYYEWIFSNLENSLLIIKIKMIFSFVSQKISIKDIADICCANIDEVAFSLSRMYPLIVSDEDLYYVFHNDVRLYLRGLIKSNSNFEKYSMSINESISGNSHLKKYLYDIVFGLFSNLEDKEHLINLFDPHYIINSVEYNLSVNKLIDQYKIIADSLVDKGDITYIDKLSVASSTIFQYINCIRWNEKESVYLNNPYNDKTLSEKYILEPSKNLADIVNDIYSLILHKQFKRAKKIFEEYLSEFCLNDFLSRNEPVTDDKNYYEKCGFICRNFMQEVLLKDNSSKPTQKYVDFVKGWLAASINFTGLSDIDVTFTFKCYAPRDLLDFVKTIFQQKELSQETTEKIVKSMLSGNEKPISVLIEVCSNALLQDINCKELCIKILQRKEELLTEDVLEFNLYKITYFHMMYFCICKYITDFEEIENLHTSILLNSHNEPGDRGYEPAKVQFECAKKLFEYFYFNSSECNKRELLFEIVYFDNNYGTGSLSDCDGFKVRKFLLKVLYASIKKHNNKSILSEICDDLLYVFTCENAKYIKELAPIFVLANEKEKYIQAADYWIGKKGRVWNLDYTDAEYYCDSIIKILESFALDDIAAYVKKIKQYKIFGYVGRKDYSLNDLLEYYKKLPLSIDKLSRYGMKLLTISDLAHEMGDNRISHPINIEIFKVAFELVYKYIDALFELKNTHDDFYYWRECLLDVFFDKLNILEFTDTELINIYYIVNSWINPDIELQVTRGYNKMNYLKTFNKKIVELIKDENLRGKVSQLGNCDPERENEYHPKTTTLDLGGVDTLIKTVGYNDETEKTIMDFAFNNNDSHVDFLSKIGEIIVEESRQLFVSNCVVEYIVQKNKYGFQGIGLEYLIEQFCNYFTNNDWLRIYENIVGKIRSDDIDMYYSVNDDLEALCRYYIMCKHPERTIQVFDLKMVMHWQLLTCGDLISREEYKLNVDSNINSMEQFRNKQIGSVDFIIENP